MQMQCGHTMQLLSNKTVQTPFLPAPITTAGDLSQRTNLSWSPFKTTKATENPTFCSTSLKCAVKTITDKAQYKLKGSEN